MRPPATSREKHLGGCAGSASQVIPGTRDMMTWNIRNAGFEMTLSPEVPRVITEHLPGVLQAFLARHGLQISDIPTWHSSNGNFYAVLFVQLRIANEVQACSYHEREIYPEISKYNFRRYRIIYSSEIRSPNRIHVEHVRPLTGMNHPCAECHFQFRKFSKTPPKIMEQIAREVSAGIPTSGQPVFLHVLFAHHFPWMNEYSHLEFFARLENREEFFFVKILLIHICADLHTAQTDFFAALQFLNRKFCIIGIVRAR
ncbi:MAG UNVERIFIED_CONTAM: hypothetical protein LVR18_45400 [Planctomycetaceae bacterium]